MAEAIRVYTDEHIDPAIVDGLRRAGIHVLTFQDAGLSGAPDELHLERATAEGCVVLTRDSDFLRLHSIGLVHAGILYAPWRMTTREIIAAVTLVHGVLAPGEMLGRVEYL